MNVKRKRKRSSGTGDEDEDEVEIHSDSVDDEGKQTAAARPPIVSAPSKRNRPENHIGHSQETFVQRLAGVCTSPYPPAQTEVSSISWQRAQLDQACIQLEARMLLPHFPPLAFSLRYEEPVIGVHIGYVKWGLVIVDVPSGAKHISTIRCFDMIVGVNGIRFTVESSQEERMAVLKTTPCPKVVNFVRYGKSVEVSKQLMMSILGLYSDEPLLSVPQPCTHQPLAGQLGSPEDRRSSSVTKPPPTEYKNNLLLENDKMVELTS